MGILGTLIGGALGFTLGGPLGALLGATIGSSLGSAAANAGTRSSGAPGPAGHRGRSGGGPPPPPAMDPVEERRVAFFVATFGVMGHIAKADGRVSEEEAQFARAVMEGLGLDADDRRLAAQLFAEGKSPHFHLDAALAQLVRILGRRRNLLRSFLEIQWKAAWADGVVHPEERRILDHIGAVLGFSRAELQQMERLASASFAPRQATAEERLAGAYGILGLERSADDDELRSAYKRLMMQHHPDRLAAQGLPEEMKEEATRRTQEIQRAYQTIRDARRKAA